MKLKIIIFLIIPWISFAASESGKKVFQTYCWGCHHQTAMAFGPSFALIASKRSKEQIIAYIMSPKAMYKSFGYKRSVMTQFHLNPKELDLISDYILSFKGLE